MENGIIIGILLLVIGGAVFYVYKAKKSGKKCIGCPDSGTCSSKNGAHGCSGSCEHCSCMKDE